MKLGLLHLLFLAAGINLTACGQSQYFEPSRLYHSSGPKVSAYAASDPMPNIPAGAMLATSRRFSDGLGRYAMDSSDRSKLSHALDNPIGKATTWVNETTNTTYTVVPTKKITINGNPFCREYTMTESRGGRKYERYGTACVDTTSSKWQSAGY